MREFPGKARTKFGLDNLIMKKNGIYVQAQAWSGMSRLSRTVRIGQAYTSDAIGGSANAG